MPNLSKDTIKKMRKVIKAVLAEPEFYDQGLFPNNSDCGTTCCAAGWAVWLDNPRTYKSKVKRYFPYNNYYWPGEAERALRLDNTGFKLFFSYVYWPYPFVLNYDNAITPIERAKVMAARWEHFIATDGAE